MRLDIHLPGEWRKNADEMELDEDLADTPQKRSKLDAFFELVKLEKQREAREAKDPKIKREAKFVSKAAKMCYPQIPTEYTWHGKDLCEFRPKGRATNKIGRVYFVNPSNQDLFYLRYKFFSVFNQKIF